MNICQSYLHSSLIFACSVEFVNIAESLNTTIFTDGHSVFRSTIEDVFFAYQLSQILPLLPMAVKRYENRKISLEYFCTQAFPFLKEIVSDNYVKHKCSDDKGCELRVVVLDGNEKNQCRICAAPKEHIV